MIISFINGKKLSKSTWPYMKNEFFPLLLNHEKTVINHIILENRIKFD